VFGRGQKCADSSVSDIYHHRRLTACGPAHRATWTCRRWIVTCGDENDKRLFRVVCWFWGTSSSLTACDSRWQGLQARREWRGDYTIIVAACAHICHTNLSPSGVFGHRPCHTDLQCSPVDPRALIACTRGLQLWPAPPHTSWLKEAVGQAHGAALSIAETGSGSLKRNGLRRSRLRAGRVC
jgi:hypothetical protein